MLNAKISNAKVIKKFLNGVSNETFLLDNNLVYRHKNIYHDGLMNDLDNEYLFLNQTSSFPYHEKIISLNHKVIDKYSSYISNTRSFHKNKKDYDHLIQYMKDLHNLKLAFFYEFPIFAFLEKNQKVIQKFIALTEFNQILIKVKEIYDKYPLVVSHNDLVKNNILFQNDKLYVIDYEYVSLNIELFDIASFLSENNLDDTKTKRYFLEKFSNKYQIEELNYLIMIEDILWATWAYNRHQETKRAIYQKIYQEKVKRVRNNEYFTSK